MKLSYLLSIFVLCLSILSQGAVSAEDGEEKPRNGNGALTAEDRTEMRDQKRDEIEGQREEAKAQREAKRCEVVGELVAKRIEIFEKTKTNHAENYDKLLARLNEIAPKLTAKDFDTTELISDIATLNTMVSEYKNKYATFVAELKTTQEVVCGDSSTPYKDKLEQSKGMLQELRTMRENIREFYLNEIREDIKALRQQAQERIIAKEEVSNEENSTMEETN